MSDHEDVHLCDDCAEELDPQYPCLLRNYLDLSQNIVNRYYPRVYENAECMYLVFKPFNKNYDFHFDAMDHIRKYIYSTCQRYEQKVLLMIITREIIATKVHYNVFLWVELPNNLGKIIQFHQKQTSRYRIHAEVLDSPYDREKVLDYMIKESAQRRFNYKIDYKVFP